jgi:lipoprotein LpqH
VKRRFVVAVAIAAIVVAGLSGCAKRQTSGASSTAKVVVGGQAQNLSGVTCTTTGANVNIGMGQAPTVIVAVLSGPSPPRVDSVVLTNVNGVTLQYRSRSGSGSAGAKATKNGNSYTIIGKATGLDSANHQVNKEFEIDVTCP